MIERIAIDEQRRNARRKGVAPSSSLRPHFLSLARQVVLWAGSRTGTTTLGITSLESRAGRSTVSFNLAAALASIVRNRVLLVEADFGKHYLSRRLGFSRVAGLSELLSGADAETECPLIETPFHDLSVLSCGQKAGQEALELPFDMIPGLFLERFSEFQFAVFDLPVANELTACNSIATQLDGVVLTVESTRIDQRKINRFKKQMQFYGVEILGVVLNKS